MNKTISAIVIVLVLLVAGWLIFFRDGGINYNQEDTTGQTDGSSKAMAVDDYISANIGGLAQEQDIMPLEGASFTVSSVEFADGSGTAYFDDGANAYMADFIYTTDPTTGATSITTFTIYPIIGEKG